MLFLHFLDYFALIYNATKFLRIQRKRESGRVAEEKNGALFCGDLLWIVSVTRIKRLIGGFSLGWFLIAVVKVY